MNNATILHGAREALWQAETKAHSAWARGVAKYALDLWETVAEWAQRGGEVESLASYKELERVALNGAQSWGAYSWGGCSLLMDSQICARLATPSEQKKTRNGERRPNGREEWLGTQARALYQACLLLWQALKTATASAQA